MLKDFPKFGYGAGQSSPNGLSLLEAEAWIQFASAAIIGGSTAMCPNTNPLLAAMEADAMLLEFRKRFTYED